MSVTSPSGSADASAQTTAAEVSRSLAAGGSFGAGVRVGAAADPRPAAVLVLRGDQRRHEARNAIGQSLRPRARRSRAAAQDTASADVAASRSAARSAVVSHGGQIRLGRVRARRASLAGYAIRPQRQLDQHPLERRREHDQHLGVVIGPPGGQADEDRAAVACRCPTRRRTPARPRDGSALRRPARRSRRRSEPVSVKRTESRLGDLERLEQDFVDSVSA